MLGYRIGPMSGGGNQLRELLRIETFSAAQQQ
jgi:hypothetical protein